MSMKVAYRAGLLTASLAAQSDLQRAKRVAPSPQFQGHDHAQIRSKLNEALTRGTLAMPRATACAEFSLEELNALEEQFFPVRSQDLFTSDLRAPKHSSLDSFRAEAEAELAYVERHPEVLEALRDSKCAELAMQWVHHLTSEVRATFAEHRLPLLADKGTREHAPELLHRSHHAIARKLSRRMTCQIGHDARPVERATWEGFPAWPYEVTYNASGYGNYPFWTRGGGTDGAVTGKGAHIRTHWSAVLNAERLDHAACGTSSLFGEDKPCTHLMLGTQYAYLFSQDESHCCISSEPSIPCHLTPMQRDFYKAFDYKGTMDNYTSEHGYYNGTVKKYGMHLTLPSHFYFWYVTDLEDKPIEQGEGPCDMYSSSGSRECRGPPQMLFHQYDPASFAEAEIDPSVFAVPEVCKATTQRCEVGPTPRVFCNFHLGPFVV